MFLPETSDPLNFPVKDISIALHTDWVIYFVRFSDK
jgi:hypothetical protein